jgi:hypothetical protein
MLDVPRRLLAQQNVGDSIDHRYLLVNVRVAEYAVADGSNQEAGAQDK